MKWRVTILCRLQSFASPLIGSTLIGFATGSRTVSWVLPGLVFLMDIMMAEYIRITTGLSIFFAKPYSNPPKRMHTLKRDQDATTNH